MLHSLLLACFITLTQGASWPTAVLVYPPAGILLIGEGRSCNITFRVDGNPFPRDKTWYKDGVKITSSSNINIDESGGSLQTLKFNSVSRDNEGTFYTIVKNDVNLEASKSPDVKLRVTYLDDVFKQSNQIVTALKGEFAVLQCHAPDHFGSPVKFSWSVGGTDLVESDNIYISEIEGNLIILQVGFDHFSSSYRCTVTIDSLQEGYQTKQGPAVTLQVVSNDASYIAPIIAMVPSDLNMDAQVKDTFRVECVVNGYPNLPSIRWYKDNVLISSSSSIYDTQKRNYLKITIPRSGGSPGGTYRCEASDNVATVSASAVVTIYTKPIITTGLPTSEVKKSSGSELALSCVATSTPGSDFRWYKNAQLLSEGINTNINGGSLLVSDVNTLNKGVYQCEAFNDVGSTISTGKITVQERLTFVIRPEDVEVFLGTSATFNCMGKGSPGPTSLSWTFNGGNPPSSHDYTNNIVNQASYKIPKVTSSDAGRISCIISSPENLYPSDTATAILTIRQGPQVSAYEKNITKNEGQMVEMVCLVENANVVTWKWLFEGMLMTQPDDLRITINNNLLQVRALSAADQGTYTCQADENGLSNSDTIFIKVKTRPNIALAEEIRVGEGDDARLTCTVTGNPTPTSSWRRNGQVVQESSKYSIETTADTGQTVLTVSAVDRTADIGDYMCYGLNDIGETFKTIELFVVAACEVMETPEDQTLEYQSSVTISCTVNNCETAIWTWKKDGQMVVFDNYRYINMGDRIELREVVPTDGGVYSCLVDSNNALDRQVTYSAAITVEVRAQIYAFPEGSRVLFKSGDDVELTCSAHGEYSDDVPLVVEWYKSSILQQSFEESQKDQNEMIAYVTKRLLIANAIASDAGHYQCVANNKYEDQDKRDTSLMLMTFPDRPGQPYDTWIGAGAVELSWSEPANTGNTPLTQYELQIETKGNAIFRPFMRNLHPLQENSVIYFLSSNQEYKFKVIAVNAVGKGEASDSSNDIRTFEDQNTPTLNLVTHFELEAISSDTILVTWQQPERKTSALRGYKVVYRNEDLLESARFVEISDYTVTQANLTDLDAGSQYSVQVESDTQVTTRLVVSSTKTEYTFNQRPTEPLSCEADREASSRLVVTWQTPANSHGKVLEYTIYYKDRHNGDGQWTMILHEDPQTTTYVLTLIDDSVDYDIRISASNSAGEGEPGWCQSIGRTINLQVYEEWWFYLIMALIGLLLIAAIILCALLVCRKREKQPQMHKVPPAKKESGWSKFKSLFSSKTHVALRNQDEFQAPGAQVYSPGAGRPPYNPMNTFAGGTAGQFSPFASPRNPAKFGGAGDFQYGQQRGPDYGRPDNYNNYGGSKYNTYDSRAPNYEPAPASGPKSPYNGGRGYGDQGSSFDNTSRYDNTYDSRYKGDTASRGGYPGTYDRSTYGGPPSDRFKSSQL